MCIPAHPHTHLRMAAYSVQPAASRFEKKGLWFIVFQIRKAKDTTTAKETVGAREMAKAMNA